LQVILLPAEGHGGRGVDSLVQPRRRGANAVHPNPAGRGNSVLAALPQAPPPALRSAPVLKRSDSVVEYQDPFEALLPRTKRLTEAQKV
jgi:hypothetical protein